MPMQQACNLGSRCDPSGPISSRRVQFCALEFEIWPKQYKPIIDQYLVVVLKNGACQPEPKRQA